MLGSGVKKIGKGKFGPFGGDRGTLNARIRRLNFALQMIKKSNISLFTKGMTW